MYLSRLQLNPAHHAARRDLANAYEMHRTLERVFVSNEMSKPARFLWRLERGQSGQLGSTVLLQAAQPGGWSSLNDEAGYLERLDADKQVSLDRLLRSGEPYRFRLLANPTVTRGGKRFGLRADGQRLDWLVRHGQRCGFDVLTAQCSARERIAAQQGRSGHRIIVDSVLFDGVLRATEAAALAQSVRGGIGHAKALGLGMLSIAPMLNRHSQE